MLRTEGLEKRFYVHRLAQEVWAFRGVEFSLEAGEFLLLEGANGVGKSSLLKVLYGTYRPTGGRALLRLREGEVDLAGAGARTLLWLRREVVGYVSQFLEPRPRTTALELVMEPLLARGLGEGVARRRAGETLEALGLRPELFHLFPTSFSGGERQKVNLARALVDPKRLLLLDEPTASLDASARQGLRERLRRLKEEGVALVGVFHHPEDVEGLVDRRYALGGWDRVALGSEARSP
ncbi:phosphonate C-P lyase system protein PhnL [Thermus thermophilus]|uniref:phosphonate C-P lyase system protein PhnL n=1 Tax=Thermus thermophilus TaxID=274 RepID=UPI001FCA9BE9|nr:ATP-binding cassette domain-containing protein [Thermus thermophilus]